MTPVMSTLLPRPPHWPRGYCSCAPEATQHTQVTCLKPNTSFSLFRTEPRILHFHCLLPHSCSASLLRLHGVPLGFTLIPSAWNALPQEPHTAGPFSLPLFKRHPIRASSDYLASEPASSRSALLGPPFFPLHCLIAI